jgi:shikimate dehydrogenase
MDRYAVIGNPIAHSLSPRIHKMFALQTRQALTYEAILAPKGRFKTVVYDFRKQGGKGLNVTLPFKLEACQLVNECSNRAKRAGAVNTIIIRQDGSLYGENTDGAGLIRDLTRNHGIDLNAQRILILGAGGAVRGVLEPLASGQPRRIVIANRTVERAVELVRLFDDLDGLQACGFDDLKNQHFDLIINGTSAALSGKIPPLPKDILNSGGICYDMFYARKPTAFVAWGRQHGARKAVNGIGMLVEQAAESFLLWCGVRPDTQSIIDEFSGSK